MQSLNFDVLGEGKKHFLRTLIDEIYHSRVIRRDDLDQSARPYGTGVVLTDTQR